MTPTPYLATWKPHRTRWWALAWCDLDSGAIYIRPRFLTYLRTLHEVVHVLRGRGNALHRGHTFHRCALSWHALRKSDDHAEPAEREAARALLRR